MASRARSSPASPESSRSRSGELVPEVAQVGRQGRLDADAATRVAGVLELEDLGVQRVPRELEGVAVFVGELLPPETRGTVRVLGVDGVEVDAAEAGSVVVPIGGERVRLRVRRLPTAGGEESELEILFRDGTNGRGTYPAGRFVPLAPEHDGQYRLDFNRARNPFCAYSSAYPCPAPWRGNTITAPVEAGERYSGSGLRSPSPGPEGPPDAR